MTGRVRVSAAWFLVAGLLVTLWLLAGDRQRPPVDCKIEAAGEALEAWAAFASTGDIGAVGEFFATDGPQFHRLQTEVATIRKGEPYLFELTDADVVAEGVVRGIVTISRNGEPDQIFQWDIEMVREGARWKLWTVRSSPRSIPNAGNGGIRQPEH